MTQAEKLEALVKKAAENGFDKTSARGWIQHLIVDDWETNRRQAPILIFNHDFANTNHEKCKAELEAIL